MYICLAEQNFYFSEELKIFQTTLENLVYTSAARQHHYI